MRNSTIKYTATAILNYTISRWQKILETFLRFLENNSYCEKGQKLRYLYTIAHNLCVDSYRGKRAEVLEEELLAEDKEDEILTGIAVKEAVSQLTEEEQELLLLKDM